MKLISVLCIVLVLGVANSQKSYDGYKLYEVNFEDGQADDLESLIAGVDGTDIWLLSTVMRKVHVFVSPEAQPKLLSLLEGHGYSVQLLNGDVATLVASGNS